MCVKAFTIPIQVNRLKGILDSHVWSETEIGNISDFFPPDTIEHIDLPFIYVRRQKSSGKFLDIGFPQLFKWEIKCLLHQHKEQLNIRQLELLNRQCLKFLAIHPIRSMKGPETFSSTEDVLKRTIWFKTNLNNIVLWRILSCSEIRKDGKFLFTDQQHDQFPDIQCILNLAQIKARGFIYVGV